jgi:GNAT superfamily N-acetyltransferase
MKLRPMGSAEADLRALARFLGRDSGERGLSIERLLPSEIPRRREDRFVLGAYKEGDALAGVADLIRAAPDRTSALIENLVPATREMYELAEDAILDWAGMKRIVLGHRLAASGLPREKLIQSRKGRYSLKLSLGSRSAAPPPEPGPAGLVPRPVRPEDASALGVLMERAFRGTIDDEGETLEQFVGEMRETLRGKYGPFVFEASFCVEAPDTGKLVAASLVTIWNELPLLAFSATDPEFQGKGLGTALIERSIFRMKELGYRELHLGVTDGNAPAQRLYAKLGFR